MTLNEFLNSTLKLVVQHKSTLFKSNAISSSNNPTHLIGSSCFRGCPLIITRPRTIALTFAIEEILVSIKAHLTCVLIETKFSNQFYIS